MTTLKKCPLCHQWHDVNKPHECKRTLNGAQWRRVNWSAKRNDRSVCAGIMGRYWRKGAGDD
jgi:hypothetical protein